MRNHVAILGVALLGLHAGCVVEPGSLGTDASAGGAAIIGRLVSTDGSAKLRALMQASGCPQVVVTLNGAPVTIVFDDDCGFLVTGVEPTELLELRVELPNLGVIGSVQISDVVDGELIEIQVETSDESLALAVLRRAEPVPSGTLPTMITGNDVTIQIAEGLYNQNLTVQGNNFTLVGEAGDDCDDAGWSVIEGEVLINGSNATFRNIVFEGGVQVRGNNARFINCCFDGELVVFGNGIGIENE